MSACASLVAAPRTAPSSPARKLLCILLQRPELGTRLGHLEDVDDDPWLKASQAIADCMEHGDLDSPSAAALIEFFRNTPHGPLMEDASSSTLEDTTATARRAAELLKAVPGIDSVFVYCQR